MIVRIATEGQYVIDAQHEQELDQLDREAVAACESDDEASFRERFTRLLEFVRANGTPIPDDQLSASDLILPPPDVTIEEARAEFSGEGLIPG